MEFKTRLSVVRFECAVPKVPLGLRYAHIDAKCVMQFVNMIFLVHDMLVNSCVN